MNRTFGVFVVKDQVGVRLAILRRNTCTHTYNTFYSATLKKEEEKRKKKRMKDRKIDRKKDRKKERKKAHSKFYSFLGGHS